jgi:hypothetical protein
MRLLTDEEIRALAAPRVALDDRRQVLQARYRRIHLRMTTRRAGSRQDAVMRTAAKNACDAEGQS